MTNISEKLTQQQFQDILINIYKKSQESERLEVTELINDIKQQMMFVMNRPKQTSIEKKI
ncbi:hypothetical protein [Peribacillus loiseleuriae]|uniref:Uncharacterized protein n=1 Tax=Peribacillus loiseleuriae TaxID=1679170 RepID=A0A0K9GZ31_9BACI|nr:hypothetical protein [Peribacillus loiseleuriae]KMY51881.1 hypothetical protein AC625_22065 [Peribacillus loiseleuriae]